MQYFFRHIFDSFQIPLTNAVLIFSLMLFIILMSPILLRKIQIPSIIGLIISGILIGPNGFGLIDKVAMDSQGFIKIFQTIGLLYIMFMAGLELDLNQFRNYFGKSLTFGFLTFIIPLGIGYPICLYVLELNPLASLLTASMFSTHTLVAYPIISKLGLSKHSSVAITVGGTILTDTAVLIILAVISNASKGNLNSSFWVSLITSLTLFSIIMFYIIPKIARWFFTKLESEKSSQYIFVLSIVFFSAFLAEMAGVEHIIGAFMAGLALNKLIPHNSILMNRIEFIGNALFIPFFLIYVGMVVDYRVLFNGTWSLIIAAVLTATAIFTKWFAALITQLIFRLSASQRQIIFGLSTAHAAATLAVIMVGYKYGILNIQIVNGTILLILITCMTASFVTEKAGKKLLIEQAEKGDIEDNQTKLRNKHLLLAINELKGNEKLLDFSLMVSDPNVLHPITVVSVLPNDDDADKTIRRSRKHLDEIVSHFSGIENKINSIATIDFNFSSGISRVSKEIVADLIVLNDSKNNNLLKRIVGDDRDHLLDVCDRTIFFCQLDKSSISYEKIILLIPPFGDLEASFPLWTERFFRFAKELSIKISVFSTEAVFERFKKVAIENKLVLNADLKVIESIDDFYLFYDKKSENDLIVFCSARTGSVSYNSEIENIPSKIQKGSPNNDVIVVYPSQGKQENVFTNYDDMQSSPLNKGVETMQKIGKEVGNIFKKDH